MMQLLVSIGVGLEGAVASDWSRAIESDQVTRGTSPASDESDQVTRGTSPASDESLQESDHVTRGTSGGGNRGER